ncbi:MAG TPA: hypothetical protein VJN43_09635 [Bryobacteraceae bacterium]|nr:hypothetical protein [Bryobacteraceae bacterium]
MAERIASVIVLAEDVTQTNFAYRALIRKGYDWRAIRVMPAPHGKGSGEQYVRENFPIEVAQYRNQVARVSVSLVTLIDADKGTVARRESQLWKALRDEGIPPRRNTERIALLIPRRNIETWILCVTGVRVNETTDYSGRNDVQEKIRPAAEKFFEWSRPGYKVPAHCIPSLRRAFPEFRRI